MVLCCVSQKQLRAEAYGPKLSDVERQIAAHNLRHQEIKAYQDQLKPSTTLSQVTEQSFTCMYSSCVQDGSLTCFLFVHRSSTLPSKRNMLNFL